MSTARTTIELFIRDTAGNPPIDNSLLNKLISNVQEDACKDSSDKIVLSMCPTVFKLATTYSRRESMLGDLISEAVIGIHNAIRTFKSEFGTYFYTHCIRHIKVVLRKWVERYGDTVKVSHGSIYKFKIIGERIAKIEDKMGRKLSLEDINRDPILTIRRVESFYNFIHPVTNTLNQPEIIGRDLGKFDMIEYLECPHDINAFDSVINDESLAILETAMLRLTSTELDIVSRRFGLYGRNIETLTSISKSYEFTRSRTGQIVEDVLKKLKNILQEYGVE